MVYLISSNPNVDYVIFAKLCNFGKLKAFAFYLSITPSHTKYSHCKTHVCFFPKIKRR